MRHQRTQRELALTQETSDAELDGFLGSASTWVAWTLWELVRQQGPIALTLDDMHGTLYVSSRERRRIETFRRGADGTWLFTLGLAAHHLGARSTIHDVNGYHSRASG